MFFKTYFEIGLAVNHELLFRLTIYLRNIYDSYFRICLCSPPIAKSPTLLNIV